MLLAPSSSFVPIRTEIAAERRSYLALAAVFVLLVIGAASLLRRMTGGSEASRHRSTLLRRHAMWAIPALCTVLGVVTFQRSNVYADPETLWREVTIAWPQNARGYINLGTAISDNPQRLSEARSLFRKAIDTDSTLASAWINIAYVDTRQGDLSNAEIELRHAMTITDDRLSQPIAVERYGRVLLGMGETDRAMPYLQRAATNRASDENFFWLGLGYLEQGQPENAVTALRHALLLNPERTDAMRYLGRALIESGHVRDAVADLKTAVDREPASGLGLALLSLAEAKTGETQAAVAAAAAASAKAGSDADAYAFAGQAMIVVHRADDAQRHLKEAVRLHPDDWQSLTNLGIADAALGERAAAIGMLQRALTIRPDYSPARRELERVQH